MIEREIMGHIIIECSPEEARLLWKRKPEIRHQLWTHAEVDAHMLTPPDTLRGIIAAKKIKPGSCL